MHEEGDAGFVLTGCIAGLVLQRKLELEQDAGGWEAQEKMFLVCVYNVSPDQPYTVFKAPCSSTALDVITQVGALISVRLSICMSLSLSVCLSVCLSVSLSYV